MFPYFPICSFPIVLVPVNQSHWSILVRMELGLWFTKKSHRFTVAGLMIVEAPFTGKYTYHVYHIYIIYIYHIYNITILCPYYYTFIHHIYYINIYDIIIHKFIYHIFFYIHIPFHVSPLRAAHGSSKLLLFDLAMSVPLAASGVFLEAASAEAWLALGRMTIFVRHPIKRVP